MLNTRWVKEHAAFSSADYAGMLGSYGKPILAITGTADLSADYRKLGLLRKIETAEVFTPRNVNHILREIDDGNSMMTVKKQYIRLAGKPIHAETAQKLRSGRKRLKHWYNAVFHRRISQRMVMRYQKGT